MGLTQIENVTPDHEQNPYVDGCQHFLQWLYKGVVKETAEREGQGKHTDQRAPRHLTGVAPAVTSCVLSGRLAIGILLEGGHVVIDIQHVDP